MRKSGKDITYGNYGSISPCKECEKRKIDCHSSCVKYNYYRVFGKVK